MIKDLKVRTFIKTKTELHCVCVLLWKNSTFISYVLANICGGSTHSFLALYVFRQASF